MLDTLLCQCLTYVGDREPTLERVNDAFNFAAKEIRLDYSGDRALVVFLILFLILRVMKLVPLIMRLRPRYYALIDSCSLPLPWLSTLMKRAKVPNISFMPIDTSWERILIQRKTNALMLRR